MSYRKSFLVFVLAFVALTLGRSQEAMGQEFDWGGPAPGSIDGGSTVLVYQCNRGGEGTNTLTLGDPDTFVSDGNVLCDFTGQVKGTGVQCHYQVEWTGDLASCVNTNAGAVVTVKSSCDNVTGVSGSLVCPPETGTFAIDLLGISSKSECERLFGRNANTLFTQITYAGQTCDTVTAITTTNLNIDCSGNKDNGNVTVCYLNQQPDFFSFDPTKLDAGTATLNGVPADLTNGKRPRPDCQIRDCNGDGVNDFQCSFPTCNSNTSIAADGVLTMITNFTGSDGGLTCTTTVGTSGQ